MRHKQKAVASEQSAINGVFAVPVKAQSREIGRHRILSALFIPDERQAKAPPEMAGPITPDKNRI